MKDMDFKIVPYLNGEPLIFEPPAKTEILAPEEAVRAVQVAIKSSGYLVTITDATEETFTSRVGELKAILKQIEAERERAKSPILSLGRGIDSAAQSLMAPLRHEIERLEKLIRAHAEAKEFERQEAVRKAEQARREKEAEEKRRLVELEKERQRLEIAKRNAIGLEEHGALTRAVDNLQAKIEQQAMILSFEESAPPELPVFSEPLIRGATVTAQIKCTLVNIRKLVEEGGWDLFDRLVKIELRQADAQSMCKRQLEANRDNPNFLPHIPGVEVTIQRGTRIPASAPVRTISRPRQK
jgi:hypothetical protein